MRADDPRRKGSAVDDDRERTGFCAVLAVIGAVMFVAGALLTELAALLVPWGCLLLVFGGLAVLQAVLIGLGVLPLPGPPRGKDR